MHIGWGLSFCTLPFALAVLPAGAQENFAGTWTVVEARVAPWVDPAETPQPQADPAMAKGTITITRDSIAGPPPLACKKAQYEVKDVGPDFLFEGGLSDPGPQAKALGFTSDKIIAVSMGCVSGAADIGMDFALIDDDTAVFALDNIIYRMKRAKP